MRTTFRLLAATFTMLACTGAGRPLRIVSLVPSLTEDLFAIGAGSSVVAVSQYTRRPAEAAKLPVVASFASIDVERIVRLHPDVIVGIPTQATLVAAVRRLGVRVVLLRDDSFDDVFYDLRELGRLTGHTDGANDVIAAARKRTDALRRSVHLPRAPRCLVVVGVQPIYTVGPSSYIGHLIELAGGRDAANIAQPYATYSAEAVVASRPDLIVADADIGLQAVLGREPWRSLEAVRAHRVYFVRDTSILTIPGPRYNEGLAWLIARFREATATR